MRVKFEQFPFLPIVFAAFKDSYNSKNENIISAFHWFMLAQYFRTKNEDVRKSYCNYVYLNVFSQKETQELCYTRNDLGKIKIQYEKPGLSIECICSQENNTFCIKSTVRQSKRLKWSHNVLLS